MRKPKSTHDADPPSPSPTAVMPALDTETSHCPEPSVTTPPPTNTRGTSSRRLATIRLMASGRSHSLLLHFPRPARPLFSELFPWPGFLPKDPDATAIVVLNNAPVIESIQGYSSALNRQTCGSLALGRTHWSVTFLNCRLGQSS